MLKQYSMMSELQILVGCVYIKEIQLCNISFFFNIIEDS